MKEIEILPGETGAPIVKLHGAANAAAQSLGIKQIHVSLSHSEGTAIALAQTIANDQ
jgi:fatty acid synthase subunit alpha